MVVRTANVRAVIKFIILQTSTEPLLVRIRSGITTALFLQWSFDSRESKHLIGQAGTANLDPRDS
jgi:hypothetical protein